MPLTRKPRCQSFFLQPKYRLAHPENYVISLFKKILSGSKHPRNILFNLETGSTGCQNPCTCFIIIINNIHIGYKITGEIRLKRWPNPLIGKALADAACTPGRDGVHSLYRSVFLRSRLRFTNKSTGSIAIQATCSKPVTSIMESLDDTHFPDTWHTSPGLLLFAIPVQAYFFLDRTGDKGHCLGFHEVHTIHATNRLQLMADYTVNWPVAYGLGQSGSQLLVLHDSLTPKNHVSLIGSKMYGIEAFNVN